MYIFHDNQAGFGAQVSFCPMGTEVSRRQSGDRSLKPRLKIRGAIYPLTYRPSRHGLNEALDNERENSKSEDSKSR